jgi:prevent-host-death family protein
MTLTVSISQLRDNLAEYLDKVAQGDNLIIRDEKKNKEVAQVTQAKTFDSKAFIKTLDSLGEVFTAERHPEWKTKKDVIKWLEKTRKDADRIF